MKRTEDPQSTSERGKGMAENLDSPSNLHERNKSTFKVHISILTRHQEYDCAHVQLPKFISEDRKLQNDNFETSGQQEFFLSFQNPHFHKHHYMTSQ